MSNDFWTQYIYFPSSVYVMEKPEYLDAVKNVSDEYLQKVDISKINELYPVRMTESYFHEESLIDFNQYILDTAWNILQSQGYKMDGLVTQFNSMWTQEHNKFSSMEMHVHADGVQLVGFYFLDCPENSSKVVFHDSRLGKIMINLPEENVSDATLASNMVNFTPEPGKLMFTNAYLPHSFTRNGSEESFKFVHFNIIVSRDPNAVCKTAAEVI